MCFVALRGEAISASYYPVDSSSQNEYGGRFVVAVKCWSWKNVSLFHGVAIASIRLLHSFACVCACVCMLSHAYHDTHTLACAYTFSYRTICYVTCTKRFMYLCESLVFFIHAKRLRTRTPLHLNLDIWCLCFGAYVLVCIRVWASVWLIFQAAGCCQLRRNSEFLFYFLSQTSLIFSRKKIRRKAHIWWLKYILGALVNFLRN